ncbi:SusC/RagA family TonB-linked outer membrane protein [Chryseobacterium sp. MDT2-18]|uniref:SusC/RagA family TonB-linked outer membrane protein n=1 Tax=Chryseobacterium sp. MDT2-18 TaxID=1259136 RepID=UPI00277DC743|nr:SusC/RagA family TonB-linked outer membrane protein [Chryseobacterium sp. MDT2-18]MDQ0476562.1 TonB-linked SusC/RagA family outer membrane protein [Chryseobacterium sp. MDT2-18]
MNVKLKVLTAGVLFFTGQAVMAQKDSTKTQNIEEVVVVAYGVQKKSTLTGANVQVGAKEIEERPISNVLQALDGAGAGIQVASGSGQPGDGISIRIRGTGSYSVSNEPLIIVDGVPFPGNLNSINPNDIESLNVLKDAASTSLYGSSAANGVIMITTKRGKKNSSKITLNTSTGISSRFIKEYDRVGPADYYVLAWEAMRNGRRTSTPAEGIAASNAWASANLITGNLKTNVFNVPNSTLVVDGVLNPNAQLKYNDFDWAEPLIGVGIRQDHNLSFTGGNDKSTYFSSLSYLKEEGYITKSDFERIGLRLNADSQVKSWLKLGTSLNASVSSGNIAVDGVDSSSSFINPYSWTRRMGPIYSPYQHDPVTGERMYGPDGEVLYDAGAMRGPDAASGRNIVWETLLNNNTTNTYNAQGNVYAEMKLLPELTFRTNGAYNYRGTLNKIFTNTFIGDAIGVGSASRTAYFNRDYTFNQVLTYDKSFGNHAFTALAGHENSAFLRDYLYGYKRNQSVAGAYEFGGFVDNTSINSQIDTRTKESWFGSLKYNFSEKYLLEGSIRWDASSRFATDVRWASFWSAGAGWVMSKENFISNIKAINLLKLRGSYGEVGNDALSSWYPYQSVFDLGYNNGTEPGVILSNVADPSISWETKAQSDIALEFELFNRRIRGTVEYYNSETRDLLFPVPTPLNPGIPGNSIQTNVGNVTNKGYELTIGVDVIKNQNVKWTVNAYGTSYKNEITKLPQESIINGSKKLMVGKDLYAFWLKTWYGVDSSDGAALYVLDQTLYPDLKAADVRTVNGTLVTTKQAKAKYEYQGSAIPDFFGNISTTLNVKNFELSAAFNYQFGGKIYDTNYAGLMVSYLQGGAAHVDLLDRWTTPGQITDVPVLNSVTAVEANAGSSRWLVDASYVMLRNASLGYNFNKDVVKNVGINSLKLFVSGENLWLSSKRQGLEPYQSFNGTVNPRYSSARIITFGLSTTF